MSKLSAFLHPVKPPEEREVVISDRFVGDDGKPVPFKIRAITQAENEALMMAATKTSFKDGQVVQYLDQIEFARRTIVAGTVEPNFNSKEMCDAYGTPSPYNVPGAMLTAGECARLMKAISGLSGFDNAALQAEVKN